MENYLLRLIYEGVNVPRWLSDKESACQADDLGSIRGSGTFPEEGNAYPIRYSCLRNPIYRVAWKITVHDVTKSWTIIGE